MKSMGASRVIFAHGSGSCLSGLKSNITVMTCWPSLGVVCWSVIIILISTGVNLSCLRCDILPILPSQHAVVCDTRYAGLSTVLTYRRLYRIESGLKGKTRDINMPTHKLTPEIINAAVEGFEQQKLRIDAQI